MSQSCLDISKHPWRVHADGIAKRCLRKVVNSKVTFDDSIFTITSEGTGGPAGQYLGGLARGSANQIESRRVILLRRSKKGFFGIVERMQFCRGPRFC